MQIHRTLDFLERNVVLERERSSVNILLHIFKVCAFYEQPSSHGRVAVLGSAHMFNDQYIDREENSKIKDVIFQFLTAADFKLNQIDADDPEV